MFTQAVQYRFWFPNSLFGRAICWFSSGPFSHVSIVVNGQEFESVIGNEKGEDGVYAHDPYSFKKTDGEVVVFQVSDLQAKIAYDRLCEMAGLRGRPRIRYAKRQLLNFVFPWLKIRDKGMYCSELGYKIGTEMAWIKSVRKREIDPNDLYLMTTQKA